MEAYSLDLRKRVAKAVEEGEQTRSEIAALYQVSESWIRRLMQRQRETGSLAPLPSHAGRPMKLTDRDRERLREALAQKADATLAELRKDVKGKVSLSTIWRTLERMGITLKKRVSVPRSKIGPMW